MGVHSPFRILSGPRGGAGRGGYRKGSCAGFRRSYSPGAAGRLVLVEHLAMGRSSPEIRLAARRLDCRGFGAPAHRLCRGLGPAGPPGCGRLGCPSPCPCSPQRGDWVTSSPRCECRCFPGAPAGLTQGLPGWPGAPQRSIDRREEVVERHGGFLAPVGKVLPASRRGDPFPATLPPEWPRLFIRSRGCSAAFEGVTPAKCRILFRLSRPPPSPVSFEHPVGKPFHLPHDHLLD